MCVSWGVQNRALDTLKLELQIILNSHDGSGKKVGLSKKVTNALDCWAIFPANLEILVIKLLSFNVDIQASKDSLHSPPDCIKQYLTAVYMEIILKIRL